MSRNPQKVSASGTWLLAAVVLNTLILKFGFTTDPRWYWALVVTGPLLWVALKNGTRERRKRIG
jgi:hypothetical protein